MDKEIKICTKCHEEHPATLKYFSPNKWRRDGLYSRCRICNNIIQKEYHNTVRGYLRRTYQNIKNRCNNLSNKYYGGRGIKNKFNSPDEFVEYVINELQVDPRNLQIDRINNDGNYEKGNIRFVTAKVNSNNRRKR